MEKVKYHHTLETIRRLLRRNARQNLRNLLHRIHYADIASIIEDLTPEEAVRVFTEISDESLQGSVIATLEPEMAVTCLSQLKESDLILLLKGMPPDDVASILDALPDETAVVYRDLLSKTDLAQVEDLLTYPEQTAARIMTQEVFALNGDATVKDAIERIRSAEQAEMVFYIYVVDDNRKLLGVVSLRKLLLAPGHELLKSIMISEVISVTTEMDQEEVAHLVARYDLLAIPVVDDIGTLLGIITVDDIIDIIHEEAKEDIYRLAGSSRDEIEESSPVKMAMIRLPWLMIRFAGGAIAFLLIIYLGQDLDNIVRFGAFLPLIMTMASGIGLQSSTIVAEGLALRSDKPPSIRALLSREFLTGILLGMIYCLITGVALYFLDNLNTAVTLIVPLLIGMMSAALIGAVLPVVFYHRGKDPISVTGSVVSSILDLLSVMIYLGSALIITRYF